MTRKPQTAISCFPKTNLCTAEEESLVFGDRQRGDRCLVGRQHVEQFCGAYVVDVHTAVMTAHHSVETVRGNAQTQWLKGGN